MRAGTDRQDDVWFPPRWRMREGISRSKWNRAAMKCWVRSGEIDFWLMAGWGPQRSAKSIFDRRSIETLRCLIKGCVSRRLWSERCSKKPDLRRGKMMCSKCVPVENECCLDGLPNGLERMDAACLDLLVL